MTVSTLRPNGTTSNTGALTGGASAHAVLSDDSDSSYVQYDANETSVLSLGDLTLPAGAVIKGHAIRLRTAKVTTNTLVSTGSDLTNSVLTTQTVSWSAPTTTLFISQERSGISDAAADSNTLTILAPQAIQPFRVYEAYVDMTYVEQPVVAVDAPASPVTDTNLPTVEWSTTLDSDGGTQTRYRVIVFTDAEYSIGGFDPETSPSTIDTGSVSSAATSWQVTEVLPDDTYRAYVLVAQTVNGVDHWSAVDYIEFTVSVALPATPTLTATVDNANARIALAITGNSGAATTDALELQRSLDGGTTWETVRQLVAGLITGSSATVYDYEAPSGTLMTYRARAAHDYSGVYAYSAWATDTETWTTTGWWLKDPVRPDLNQQITVRDLAPVQRAGRRGIFQALGATSAVVVTDTRGPKTGTITLRESTLDDQDAIDVLLDTLHTLLLQGPANHNPPGYVRLGEQSRARVLGGGDATEVFDALEYTVVASPTDDVVAWP